MSNRDPNKDDLILEVLLEAQEDQRAAVSSALLKELYELQRKHQFDPERDLVILATKRAVETEVDNTMAAETK